MTIPVAMFEHSYSPAQMYRLTFPAEAMTAHNKPVKLLRHNMNPSYVNAILSEAEVMVLWRTSDDDIYNMVVEASKRESPAVVIDTDDDITAVDPANPRYCDFGLVEAQRADGGRWIDGKEGFDIGRNRHRIDMVLDAMRRADGLTVPTEALRQRMLKHNDNIAVFPNCVNTKELRPLSFKQSHCVRLGWQGDISHIEDVSLFLAPLARYFRENKADKIVICGSRLIVDPITAFLKSRARMDCCEPYDTIIDIRGHYWRMMALNLDVGLIPLIDTEFNRSRSDIKFTEFAAMGVPCVVSNVMPYKDVVVDGETGLLVENTPEAWHHAISRLAKDRKLRKRIGDNARQWAIENRDVHSYSQARWDFYHGVHKTKRARHDMHMRGVERVE